jgi:hypothetical protein
MRVDFFASIKHLFEGTEPDDPDVRELLPDLWATLQLISRDRLAADRGGSRAGHVFQYVRDVRAGRTETPLGNEPGREPPVKFSSRGKCVVLLGIMPAPEHVRYHSLRVI